MPLKFVYICDLLQKLESLELQDRDIALRKQDKEAQYRCIIEDWFRSHRAQIDSPGTDRAALLSSLFPERRTDRVYWLQPPSLLKVLGRCLGFGAERLQRLNAWKLSNDDDLASWVANIVRETDPGTAPSNITIEDIDRTLECIAARFRFSGPQIRLKLGTSSTETTHSLLKPLITRLPSHELKWFLRLILKNFHPIVLPEHLIQRRIHFLLPQLLKFQSSFDAAAGILKCSSLQSVPPQPSVQAEEKIMEEISVECLQPRVGVKIGRPSFVKARSLRHCLQLTGNKRWVIEPKYDGEYCQVHIDLSKGKDCIQIFAKSGRDATEDRRGLHSWIRRSLGIGSPDCRFKQKCILEGEMVVYDKKNKSISEFHKIRKHVSRTGSFLGTELDSQAHSHEHLKLMFFDVLLLDEEIPMSSPYCERRQKLKDLVLQFEGCMERTAWGVIDFSKTSEHRAMQKLQRHFSKSIALRFEGLALKPYDGPYLSLKRSGNEFTGFIKMKKDYIPGLGDSTDFAVVGASRDIKEPPIPGIKWNRFAIASICNKEDVLRFRSQPVFRVLDSLCRPCISEDDARFISATAVCFGEPGTSNENTKQHTSICSEFETELDVQFVKPVIVEVLGSGFDKPPSKGYYMLRHARITKIHRDRGVEDVVSFDELQEMARKAINLPADVVLEESKWMRALETASRPKNPVYATNQSPFSSKSATSQSTTASSPLNTLRRPRMEPLAQMVSREVLSEEAREYSSSSNLNDSGFDLTPKAVQLPTPPLESSVHTIAPKMRYNGQIELLKDSGSIRKRKRKASSTVQGCRRKMQRSEVLSSSDLSHSPEALLPSEKRPLADITNHVTQSTPAISSPLIFYDAYSERIHLKDSTQLCENPVREESQDSFHSVVSRPDQPHAAAERYTQEPHSPSESEEYPLDHYIDTSIPSQTSRAKAKLGAFPQRQDQCSDSELHFRKADLTGILKHSVIYISPCLHRTPYLTEDLLPVLGSTQTTTYLSHWSRDLLYQPPSAPVVGESQAYVGLQKLVLVESKRSMQTDEVIENLRGLKLSVGEEVMVWDWRMAECLVELLRLECTPSTDHDGGSLLGLGTHGLFELGEMEKSQVKILLAKRLSKCYIGRLTMYDQVWKSHWCAADVGAQDRAARSLLQSSKRSW